MFWRILKIAEIRGSPVWWWQCQTRTCFEPTTPDTLPIRYLMGLQKQSSNSEFPPARENMCIAHWHQLFFMFFSCRMWDAPCKTERIVDRVSIVLQLHCRIQMFNRICVQWYDDVMAIQMPWKGNLGAIHCWTSRLQRLFWSCDLFLVIADCQGFTVISCGPPGEIARGMSIGEDFTYGRSVRYICDLGTWIYQGVFELEIFCLENGRWSELPSDCTGNPAFFAL